MKINTKSWHYKIATWGDEDAPRTLCPYFWKVVFKLAVAAFMVIAAFAGIFGVGEILMSLILPSLGFAASGIIAGIANVVVGTIAWAGFFGTVFVVGYGCVKLKNYRDNARVEKRMARINAGLSPDKDPNLVTEFLKAKHRKVCPFLEFEAK